MTHDPESGPLPGVPPDPAPTLPPLHAADRWEVEFHGEGGPLFALTLVNTMLNLLTLGIWFAWGRVKELRYLVGNVVVAGDPMSFHGRGAELFRGIVLAFFLVLLPLYALMFVAGNSRHPFAVVGVLVIYLLFGLFVVFVSVGSLRYRLPRTSWRGIRFGFDGSPLEFVGQFIGRGVLLVVSLGIYYPWYACWRRRWVLERTRFGNVHFACDAEPQPLVERFIASWILGFFTFGLAWVWYQGHQQAHLWNHSRIGESRFHCTLTGGDWVWLHVQNVLVALFTLGIAMPWVVVRTHSFLLGSLSLDAGLDLAAIRQQLQETGSLTEGALDALGLDSGLDLG